MHRRELASGSGASKPQGWESAAEEEVVPPRTLTSSAQGAVWVAARRQIGADYA
jgi:hypothetical protein